ncbi:hypothetical protein HF576_05860 [Microbacterium sp. CFH 90308]|uniref:Phosphoglycerol transferase MdoB-like AlkP superfamily enzyme n=1 Tax=Microbacterium salsuginis TaxID=2722803 RepID=A0ABX1KBJ7_9MICO|nr:hypothetical protein [Microbacterium sp. CFH 90308]NLP83363.1 hypothetical protein [Microbacterium sp. CFH 90308]
MARRREAAFPVRGGLRGGAPLTLIACTVLLLAPLVPGVLSTGSPAALVGLPGESVVALVVLLTVAGSVMQRLTAGMFAAVVVAGILLAALDLAFRATIDRPFNLAEDGGAIGDAFGVVQDAVGPVGAAVVVVLIAAAVVGLGVVVALSALRVGRAVRGEGPRGRAAIAALAATWVVFSLAGSHVVAGTPVAAFRAGDVVVAASERAAVSVREQQAFERALATDPLASEPPAQPMAGLAGKDVVIAFIESYGRVAVEPSPFTEDIARTLDEGAGTLQREGYAARSAFLTSPTLGGVSWLAHATLQSGLRVDSPRTYDRLLEHGRSTITGLFDAAGWRTMAVVPSNKREWPEGEAFYGFDTVLDSRNMGYRGPAFGYARMPDQYTWKVFHDLSDLDGAQPVMAEIDFVSSHTPWTPLPRMVPWDDLGDGSVFADQVAEGESPVTAWTDPEHARELYGESVAYSLEALFSYLETFEQQDLVLIVVGDHQPARIVSGRDAGYDVPITIIAKDDAVFEAVQSWEWEAGLRPSADAPVWGMEDFRDRFVEAFSR